MFVVVVSSSENGAKFTTHHYSSSAIFDDGLEDKFHNVRRILQTKKNEPRIPVVCVYTSQNFSHDSRLTLLCCYDVRLQQNGSSSSLI